MFHVKICGVTTAGDARLVAAAGADAIGLNFVPGSPRRLDPALAHEVAAAIPDDVLVVGNDPRIAEAYLGATAHASK